MSKEVSNQIQFGLRNDSYVMGHCKPGHRLHKYKQGKEPCADQVVDFSFSMSILADQALGTDFFAAAFRKAEPKPEGEPEQGEIEGMESSSEFRARRVGKIALGKDNGYQTSNYVMIIDNGTKEGIRLEPEQGLELREIEGQDENHPYVESRWTAKDVAWHDFMLGCMGESIGVRFEYIEQPVESTIEDMVGDDEDEGDD